MSIFKKYICSECSKIILSPTKLFGDGKCLCKDCAKTVFSLGLAPIISYEEYKDILKYQKETYSKYNRSFNETYSYGNIHVDAKKHIFYIGNLINANTVFLSFRNIKSCTFTYEARKNAECWFGKVACTVNITFEMSSPQLIYNCAIRDKAPATYERSEDGGGYDIHIYSCNPPRGLKAFLSLFYKSYQGSVVWVDLEESYGTIKMKQGENPLEALIACVNHDADYADSKYEEKLAEEDLLNYIDSLPEEHGLCDAEYKEVMEFLQNRDQ